MKNKHNAYKSLFSLFLPVETGSTLILGHNNDNCDNCFMVVIIAQATFKGWIDIMKHATDIKDVRR